MWQNINLKIKKKTCQLISTKLAVIYKIYFKLLYKKCDVFESEIERFENITLTLVKRSTECYNASFRARSWNVSIT